MIPVFSTRKRSMISTPPPPTAKKLCVDHSKNDASNTHLNREQIQQIANQALDELQKALQNGTSIDLRIWKEQNNNSFRGPNSSALKQIQLIRFGALVSAACKRHEEYFEWIRGFRPEIRNLHSIYSLYRTPSEVVDKISTIPGISEGDKLTAIAYYINVNKAPLIGYIDLFNETEWSVIARSLRYVNLEGIRPKEKCENIINNCDSIVYLKINSPYIKQLPELPDCEELDCEDSISLTELPKLPKCRILKCNGCRFLQVIPTLPRCTIIRCSFCPRLKEIQDQPECIDLLCGGCIHLTLIGGLPKCEDLNCSECISLEVLPPLENCKRLVCPSCTYLRIIPKLPNCYHLDCRFCPSITRLEGLNVCEILETANCVNLCNLPKLDKCIELRCPNCTNLSRLPSLPICNFLDIRETSINTRLLNIGPSCTINFGNESGFQNCRSLARTYIGNSNIIPSQFEVEESSIAENPVKLLERLGALYLLPSGCLPNIVFKRGGQFLSGMDFGGLKKDFISRLLSALFKTSPVGKNFLEIEDGFPVARGGEMERDTYFALGKLLAFCYYGRYSLCLGNLFSDKFYECLSVKGNAEMISKRWYLNCYLILINAPSEIYRLFEFNFPYQALSQEEFEKVHYYIDPMQELGIDVKKLLDKSYRLSLYEKLVTTARENGQVMAISYIVKSMAETIRFRQWFMLRELTPTALRLRIQGVLSAEELLKRLQYLNSSNATGEDINRTKGFLTSWIKQADNKNLELFVEAVTGLKTLEANTYIRIRFVNVGDQTKHTNHYPVAHTCYNELELPTNYLDKNHFSVMLSAVFSQLSANERFQLN